MHLGLDFGSVVWTFAYMFQTWCTQCFLPMWSRPWLKKFRQYLSQMLIFSTWFGPCLKKFGLYLAECLFSLLLQWSPDLSLKRSRPCQTEGEFVGVLGMVENLVFRQWLFNIGLESFYMGRFPKSQLRFNL